MQTSQEEQRVKILGLQDRLNIKQASDQDFIKLGQADAIIEQIIAEKREQAAICSIAELIADILGSE